MASEKELGATNTNVESNSPTLSLSESTSAQAGVTKVEALAQAWGKSGLIVAYVG